MASRIGVFGGTFDPIHVGHLVAAANVRHALALERVLLVVANEPWQKSGQRAITPAPERLAMVAASVSGHEALYADDREIRRGGPSYTADTLAELTAAHRDAELFLVLGSDAVKGLDTWERIEEVRRLATLVVVNRAGMQAPFVDPSWRVEHVDIPNLEISSTQLRARARDGRPLDFLVPEAAVRLVRERGLYAGDG
jgi:nicotinate-nucleotide adenylyltransferase